MKNTTFMNQIYRFCFCLGFAVSGMAIASEEARLAAAAEEAFDKGDYAAAINNYEQLVKAGVVNGHLYYNLGMAYYRSGQRGESVAAFLAARRYLPRDPDTAANLRFVLGTIRDKLEPEQSKSWVNRVGFWIDRLTMKELAWAAVLICALWGSVMTAVLLIPMWNTWRWYDGATSIVPAILLLSLAAKGQENERWGAVEVAKAKVYSGPGTLNPVVFELQEGAPALITEVAAGGFYRIQLSDGKKGWISGSQLKVFGPL